MNKCMTRDHPGTGPVYTSVPYVRIGMPSASIGFQPDKALLVSSVNPRRLLLAHSSGNFQQDRSCTPTWGISSQHILVPSHTNRMHCFDDFILELHKLWRNCSSRRSASMKLITIQSFGTRQMTRLAVQSGRNVICLQTKDRCGFKDECCAALLL